VPVRAFLFDFDGLIVDTEVPSRAGWEHVYRERGHELPAEKWALMVGTVGGWDPMAHLEDLVGGPLAHDEVHASRRAHEFALIDEEELRPGVLDYLEEAERRGLKRAIVSSSSRPWIDMHIARLAPDVRWDAIVTADHDEARAKPRPDLYLEALGLIGVDAADAVAFEDSPNGVRAAKAAGIFCVAVPNEVTRSLGLDEADLVLESLAELPPDELIARRGGQASRRP
jgi:HAD superfamily hydrolase (TIGR01509 family)